MSLLPWCLTEFLKVLKIKKDKNLEGYAVKKFKKFHLAGLALVLILSVALTACGTSSGGNKNASGSNGTPLGKKNITIPFVAWAGTIARTHLMKAVLEDAGYNVTLTQVQPGAMYAGTAGGSGDFFMAGWLPLTHKDYWNQYKDKLVKVGTIIEKAPLGLTVPTYMKDVNSIADLKGNTKIGNATNWTITGIGPGAGEMKATKKVITAYGLDKWKLQSSSGTGMTSALKKAEDSKKPIIVTLWKPHWAFGQWDLKILKDPKKIYGTADHIYAIARKGFKKDSPGAYQIVQQFAKNYGYDQENPLMVTIQNGTDPDKAAQQFVKKHAALVKKWEAGVAVAK